MNEIHLIAGNYRVPLNDTPHAVTVGNATLYLGDCLNVLPHITGLPHAIVTDPPYGLSFMNKHWDYEVPSVDIWRQCIQVLLPGGHLLAFSGTRTQHRMAVRIEDAGFEIRDMIAWVYGSGFPKSRNLDGGWQGWGTALKPALEPITVARKPLIGTVAENVLAHGTGALNIDGCRVEGVPPSVPQPVFNSPTGRTYGMKTGEGRNGEMSQASGRWPANLIHDGSEEVIAHFPDSNGSGHACTLNRGPRTEDDGWGMADKPGKLHDAGTGSAARFFYCAKASKSDRGPGNNHPTVKPTALMRYLCRLVTPPGGVVLDPFMGSGTTGKAAMLEGFRFIGLEKDPASFEIAVRRLREFQ